MLIIFFGRITVRCEKSAKIEYKLLVWNIIDVSILFLLISKEYEVLNVILS